MPLEHLDRVVEAFDPAARKPAFDQLRNDDLFQNETSVVPSFHNCARKLAQPVFHLEPRHALLAFFYTVAQLRHPVADNINSPSCS
jgi:hypothetical protein